MASDSQNLPSRSTPPQNSGFTSTQKRIPDPNELQRISQEELNEIIAKHAMYLRGQSGGARAIIQFRDISQANLRAVDLSQADFTGSMFIETDLSNSVFVGASFFACDLRNANLFEANLSRADLRGAYIAGADLTRANLNEADLRTGKIMKRAENGSIEDRKYSGSKGPVTVLAGANMLETNMVKVNASEADFTDANLCGANLTQADIQSACFESANLTDGDLSGANLSKTSFKSSIIAGTLMAESGYRDMDLSGARYERDMGDKLESLGKSLPELLKDHTKWVASKGETGIQLDLSDYDMRDVLDLKKIPLTAIRCIGGNFLHQDLRRAELQSAQFDKSDFSDCNMWEADLRGSSFKYARFCRANLKGAMLCPLEFQNPDGTTRLQRADMSGANLRYVNFTDADLRHVIFMGVDLTSAVIRNCDMRGADLTGAILQGAILENVNLEGAIIDLKMV